MKLDQIYLTDTIFESWYKFGYLLKHHIDNDLNCCLLLKILRCVAAVVCRQSCAIKLDTKRDWSTLLWKAIVHNVILR
jgi:hypothetical protein